MQTGLHIGLAAWLHANCDGAGFASWPSAPHQTALARLESAQDGADMARVAEFSRMVNFAAQKDQPAEPFAATALWHVHAQIIRRMIFAERAWTEWETREFDAARAMLYTEGPLGLPQMTARYSLYQEHSNGYTDLVLTDASDLEISAAMTAWIVEGSKLDIEAAQATITRLAGRSTLPLADADRLRVDGVLPVDPAGLPYAMTGFSPISAVYEAGWLNAEVDLQDLQRALDHSPAGLRAWQSWVGTRMGSVRFRYAVLSLHRDWLTEAIYAADDWTLSGSGVSDGTGAKGVLPAIPNRVYLVREAELRLENPRPAPAPRPANPLQPGRAVVLRTSVPLVMGQIAKPAAGVVTMQPRSPVVTAAVLSKDVLASATIKPLPSRASVRPAIAASLSTVKPAARAPVVSSPLRTGKIVQLHNPLLQKIDGAQIQTRLTLARSLIAARATNAPPANPPPTPRDQTIWVVGFGCDPLPQAPNANPSYRWPANTPV
ncbi:hypothetical protein P775_01115 [Puniceibacterium antarcticum]|uniref:Uncharacterized protein n=1 Tax=Puniceibacterium antarcticum TaxID=1206336 RepID=A0A2G8RKM3_9RHOB|nr:hypothetical protein [Puniceibacterium antarcticum]PIL22097.1 hypothetical protein P775_01115 [Puniceibacterium antarcticum]